MRIETTVDGLRRVIAEQRREGLVGVVPTMGYLHDGHTRLVERSARECAVTVVTIFVNPLQFAAGEDLDAYPRDPDGDALKARDAGATLLFCPSDAEMYPDGRDGVLTTVAVPALAAVMEGASRPTHFAGVCTVVSKLFNIVSPDRAYFGEKDYQQLAILRQMAKDLSAGVEVVGCRTERADDGLALSSRNVYLSDHEREQAPALHRALREGAAAIAAGERDVEAVRSVMGAVLADADAATIDYLEIADRDTLAPLATADPSRARLFGAVKFSRARLIDNVGIDTAGTDTAGTDTAGTAAEDG